MGRRRKFDHDEARARYAAGESLTDLASAYGVSYNAVWSIATEQGQKYVSRWSHARWHRERRQPCKGGCGRLVWITTGPGRSGFCPTCVGLERAETVRPDSLLCTRCGEWKPDGEFPRKAVAKARRGRHALCRSCQTIEKRAHRAQLSDADRERIRAYDRERHRRKAAA